LYHNKIKNLTLDQILNNDKTVKSLQEFSEITGMDISELKFNKLRGIANCAVRKFSKNESYEKKTDTVQNFLMRIKRGSKTIRNILQGSHTCTVSQNILKYAELTDTFINADHSSVLNSSWISMGYLHNSVKTFIFKLHNNILGINSRVAHFVRNHPNTCTFCDIIQAPEENSESIKHLFFECNCVENLLTDFYTWIFSTDHPRYISKFEFFVGFNFECNYKNTVLHLINILVKKYIWDCKLRFTIPVVADLKLLVSREIEHIYRLNSKMRIALTRSNLFVNHEIHF